MFFMRRLAGILSTLHPPAFEQGDFPFLFMTPAGFLLQYSQQNSAVQNVVS